MEAHSAIHVKCPNCGTVGRGKESLLNRDVKCPKCEQQVRFVRVDVDAGESHRVNGGNTAGRQGQELPAEAPMPIAAPPNASAPPTRSCPYCGEQILALAQKCKHCGEWLSGTPAARRSTRIWPIKIVPVWNIPLFLFLTLNIYNIFWLARIVRELHDRDAIDITPGKAVGFCFIPFYNLVWFFILWGKIGGALRKIHDKNNLPLPATGVVWLWPIGLILALILNLAVPFAGTFLAMICLSIVLCTIQAAMNRVALATEDTPLR